MFDLIEPSIFVTYTVTLFPVLRPQVKTPSVITGRVRVNGPRIKSSNGGRSEQWHHGFHEVSATRSYQPVGLQCLNHNADLQQTDLQPTTQESIPTP